MSRLWLVVLGILLVCTLIPSKKKDTDWTGMRESVVEFNVEVSTTVAGSTQTVKNEFIGSGFVVTPDGYIITCAHVVDGAKDKDISVHFYGAPGFGAKPHVIYVNGTFDIALVKVDLGTYSLPYMKLGKSEDVVLGDYVYTIGHPHGFEWSAYKMMVSAKRFTSAPMVGSEDEEATVEPYVIQLGEPVAPGISGAPIWDDRGRVVCMANIAYMAKRTAQINFCLPADEIRWVLETQGIRYN